MRATVSTRCARAGAGATRRIASAIARATSAAALYRTERRDEAGESSRVPGGDPQAHLALEVTDQAFTAEEQALEAAHPLPVVVEPAGGRDHVAAIAD